MNHNITRNVSGHNIDDFIQPICSCGWQGQKHYGYDDYQMTNLQAAEKRHLQIAYCENLLKEAERILDEEISNDHHD